MSEGRSLPLARISSRADMLHKHLMVPQYHTALLDEKRGEYILVCKIVFQVQLAHCFTARSEKGSAQSVVRFLLEGGVLVAIFDRRCR